MTIVIISPSNTFNHATKVSILIHLLNGTPILLTSNIYNLARSVNKSYFVSVILNTKFVLHFVSPLFSLCVYYTKKSDPLSN
jgi:hypothetical protein